MFRIPDKIKNEVPAYEQSLKKLLNGEIKEGFFKGIRVPWGFYSQRGGKIFMSRLRIPAGEITCRQLKAIAEASTRFASGRLHITTRQDIQIHDLSIENTIKVINYLEDYNLSPRGGGGNTVRNITSCYLAGVCPYEKINVIPIAQRLSEYLLSLDYSYTLPRKFKVAFSGCDRDCAGAALNDVGFIATDDGGETVFKMLVGGGMGAKSSVGKLLKTKVSAQDIYRETEAVMELFLRYGDRKDRHHNRLRFLIQQMGAERFEDIYRGILDEKIKNTPSLLLTDEKVSDLRAGGRRQISDEKINRISVEDSVDENYRSFLKYNVLPQKSEGLFCVLVRIPQGEIPADDALRFADGITEILSEMSCLRTTQRQNIAVINIESRHLEKVYRKLIGIFGENFLYPDTIYDVVSCKAALTCNLGICNAMALAPEITKRLMSSPGISPARFAGFSININGCPNACGRHPAASLSFAGMAKKIGGHTAPFYRVYAGGKTDGENTRLSEEIGAVPARAVPDVVEEFLENVKNTDDIADTGNIELLKGIVKKFSYVPGYEENRSYYIDYGRSEDFTLEGLSQGECGAGVIDMMESDIESAAQLLERLDDFSVGDSDDGRAINTLAEVIGYASRALLVTRGIDPKNENESAQAFVDKFVKEGVASREFENLTEVIDTLRNSPGRDSYRDYLVYARRLVQEVRDIYKSMDGNFNFPRRYEVVKETHQKDNTSFLSPDALGEKPQGEKQTADVYDLRGTPCPINYVKAKIRLETLGAGDLLEIWLDDGEPIKNVPVSLKNDGQEILGIYESGADSGKKFFRVMVKKRV